MPTKKTNLSHFLLTNLQVQIFPLTKHQLIIYRAILDLFFVRRHF